MLVDKAQGQMVSMDVFINLVGRLLHKISTDFVLTFGVALDLAAINYSYITLVPKMSAPQTPNDYRPISLMNFSVKILCKIFADRLQVLMLRLVH
jgi:hypothetical protein